MILRCMAKSSSERIAFDPISSLDILGIILYDVVGTCYRENAIRSYSF